MKDSAKEGIKTASLVGRPVASDRLPADKVHDCLATCFGQRRPCGGNGRGDRLMSRLAGAPAPMRRAALPMVGAGR
jgi:hypothetical protein